MLLRKGGGGVVQQNKLLLNYLYLDFNVEKGALKRMYNMNNKIKHLNEKLFNYGIYGIIR